MGAQVDLCSRPSVIFGRLCGNERGFFWILFSSQFSRNINVKCLCYFFDNLLMGEALELQDDLKVSAACSCRWTPALPPPYMPIYWGRTHHPIGASNFGRCRSFLRNLTISAVQTETSVCSRCDSLRRKVWLRDGSVFMSSRSGSQLTLYTATCSIYRGL